jgi:hypothetical protein
MNLPIAFSFQSEYLKDIDAKYRMPHPERNAGFLLLKTQAFNRSLSASSLTGQQSKGCFERMWLHPAQPSNS